MGAHSDAISEQFVPSERYKEQQREIAETLHAAGLNPSEFDTLYISAQTWAMTSEGVRVPKKHDRVTAQGYNGVFAVLDVDAKSKTADLQFVTGDGPVVRGVAWTTLSYMDKEDVNQAPVRTVRETTQED